MLSLGRTLKTFAQVIGPHYSGMTQFYRAMGARVLVYAEQIEILAESRRLLSGLALEWSKWGPLGASVCFFNGGKCLFLLAGEYIVDYLQVVLINIMSF